jgi:hypothetical protein
VITRYMHTPFASCCGDDERGKSLVKARREASEEFLNSLSGAPGTVFTLSSPRRLTKNSDSLQD